MQVIWTDAACRSLEFKLTCSGNLYPRALLRKLNASLKEAEYLLAANAYIGGQELLAEGRDYEYRHVVLCKPFKLIYFICGDAVYIADVWDTRQSPRTLERLT